MVSAAHWLLPSLLGTAVLLPLVSFFVILVFGPRMGTAGLRAGHVATGAIGLAAVFSFVALFAVWLPARALDRSQSETPAESHAAAAGDPLVRAQSPDRATEVRFAAAHAEEGDGDEDAAHTPPKSYTGEFQLLRTGRPWLLGQFGDLRLSISYYIDSLTLCMFCMVSLIATLIHVYSMGYMHEELHDVTDPEVRTPGGTHLKRPGRYPRFFQYLSLFSFSMLGLVLSGNVAMVFVFWELVGICSYFLIGFYVERKSASTAANKAFIVNRVGDFGMIIGMMALWSALGTLSFGDVEYHDQEGTLHRQAGIFNLVRHGGAAQVPAGMARFVAREEVASAARQLGPHASQDEISALIAERMEASEDEGPRGGYGYWLLIVAGVGIFSGCVGKSAQFPLHVWLPDAMEGPTPVSALVHSATMVAAGVYLVGRFYPAFVPEVLLVIAIVGCLTLFLAATIAVTATDIKRVLAYSTISQLGYMMMALGVGAWLAGMMHLITHAFFKSLLFMCSGSVIHAVHTNEMTEMGGLWKKMPVTALTMLVGCLAISGAGIPFFVGWLGGADGDLAGLGLSGFYSKDAILEQAFAFMHANSSAWAGVFFVAAAAGAAITAFYMFRLWYLTFVGQPRDAARYEHAHESPPAMYVPLIVLAVMAITVAWRPVQGILASAVAVVALLVWRFLRRVPENSNNSPSRRLRLADVPLALSGLVLVVSIFWTAPPLREVVLSSLLEQSEPVNVATGSNGVLVDLVWPSEHDSHEAAIVFPVTLIAMGTAIAGFVLATLMYGVRRLDADDVRRQFQPVYRFLLNKWWFDELYDRLFVWPTLVLSRLIARIDRSWIDWFVDGLAKVTRTFAVFWDRLADQRLIDGTVNLIARWTYAVGNSLRGLQTGQLRQYVMFIVIGAVALFILISLWTSTLAG